MILFTDSIFITDEAEGFRICRETRTTSSSMTMTLMLCTAGYIDLYYHGEMLRVRQGDLFVRIPDFTQPIGEYKMSEDFKLKHVAINASIFEQVMYDHMRVEPNWWSKQEYVKQNPIFHLDEKSIEFFEANFHLLSLQLNARMTDYRKQILMLFAKGAMMELLNYMDKLAVGWSEYSRPSVNRSDYLFREFMRLLQLNPHEREVQWFAKQLNVTPKYLSEVCKDRSKKSAGEWITEITVSEVKHYLQNTTMPIRDVARVLSFPNASFFCQYTKKHLGVSPNHFRKEKKR